MTRLLPILMLFGLCTGGCRQMPPVGDGLSVQGKTGSDLQPVPLPQALRHQLAEYERNPTPESAADVWDSLTQLADRIAGLAQTVARSKGGVRAEAELERITLARIYEVEGARFVTAQARTQAALEALAVISRRAGGGQGAAEIFVHDAQPWLGGIRAVLPGTTPFSSEL